MPTAPPPSTTEPAQPARVRLGTHVDTLFDVAAQAPSDADVDLSVACMFEREFPGAVLGGGLLHLDQALDGALTSARSAGHFRARVLDSLLVTAPPPRVRARAILVVGLGDPQALDAETLSRACAFAVTQAIRLNARTAAFAPSLLDSGLRLPPELHAADAMLAGAFSALALSDHLGRKSLAAPSTLRAWTFDAGVAHFDATVGDFMGAFAGRA